MELWLVVSIANLVIAGMSVLIAADIFLGLRRTGEGWRGNPIAVATAGIFATCAVGHTAHAMHALIPAGATGFALFESGRVMMDDWRLLAWDGVTAVLIVWYWTLRSRFGVITHGVAMFEDMEQRHADAMDLHDSVVQGLAEAKAHLDTGNKAAALDAVDRTLGASRSIITGLLGDTKGEYGIKPGKLRREGAAG